MCHVPLFTQKQKREKNMHWEKMCHLFSFHTFWNRGDKQQLPFQSPWILTGFLSDMAGLIRGLEQSGLKRATPELERVNGSTSHPPTQLQLHRNCGSLYIVSAYPVFTHYAHKLLISEWKHERLCIRFSILAFLLSTLSYPTVKGWSKGEVWSVLEISV